MTYSALVTDINLKGEISGWEVAGAGDQSERRRIRQRRHHRRMGFTGRAEQHLPRKAVRACAGRDSRFATSQHGHADLAAHAGSGTHGTAKKSSFCADCKA
jgi:hypothetical protein